jgi:hypothetical protein
MNQSEVAYIRQKIVLEYEAAQRGLSGLAQGVAIHAFITKRMENIAASHEALKTLVGEQKATQIIVEVLEQVSSESEQDE